MMNPLIAWGSFLLVPLFAWSALSDTCSTAEATTSIEIERPLGLDYLYQQTQYWSTACGDLKPTCILSPKTADEAAAIVKILLQNNDTFAIKSGGHNPNNYYSSVDGGPLISTRRLNEVTLDTAAQTVRVGPGNRWDDVENALDGTNFTVVGGRIGNVGVGGYILGGGLSFKSAEYGWTANTVLEFEVVLANGTIVRATNESNADLFSALKGGGNNYGIVTSYLLQAYPQGQIWGGNYIFGGSEAPRLLSALRDFVEYYPDEKAGIILTAEKTIYGAVDIWVMFLYYNGPTPPAGVFDNFTAIGPTINTCKTRSYADLLTANNLYVVPASVYTIATETTPLPNATVGMEVLEAYYNHWRNTTDSVIDLDGLVGSIAFQPIPKSMSRLAASKGGDLIGLDDSVDRIILEFDYSYLFDSDTPAVDTATQKLYGGMREIISGFVQSGKLPDAYLPLFLNDGYFRQDYWGRSKSADFARTVAERVDPGGFFQKRTGGFKLQTRQVDPTGLLGEKPIERRLP